MPLSVGWAAMGETRMRRAASIVAAIRDLRMSG